MLQDRPARTDAAPPTGLPWVSVIVTNHNYGRYLAPCLDSIAAQSYGRIEPIIVDDGSTDGSDAVLREIEGGWGRGKLAVVRSETTQGQYLAMRQGLAAATGQFVVFVDADDLLHEDFVATHVACHLSEQAHVALSTSDQWLIDKDGFLVGVNPRSKFRPFHALPRRFVREATLEDPVGEETVAVEEVAADANHAGYWIWGTTSSMMFRRDVLALIMTPAFEMRICADEYLANFAHAIGGTAVIRKVLGMYRRHGGNNFSNNAVLGGFVPLTRRSVASGPDPKASIADCLEQESALFCDALGERQFANVVMRFCSIERGRAILRRSNVAGGLVAGQVARRRVRSVQSALGNMRRELSWLLHRRPTYW